MSGIFCSKCGTNITRDIKYRNYYFSCSCGWANTSLKKLIKCPECGVPLTGTHTHGFLCKKCIKQTLSSVDKIAKTAIKKAYTKDKFTPENIDDVNITSEYLAIKRLVELNISPILVMGKAGTGKSTFIRFIRRIFQNRNVVVVAPTGVAALNAKGSTINSFFRFPPKIIQLDDIKIIPGRKLYKKLDILIIDEISMVRADLLDAINLFLQKNGKDEGKLFGGSKVILIGDIFQLPPVVGRKEERILHTMNYSSPYFFSANCLKGINLIPIELTHVYRQADTLFINLLDQLRIANDSNNIVAEFNKQCYGRPQLKGAVTLATTNAIVDSINKLELAKINYEERVFLGCASGSFDSNDTRLPAPMRLVLKIGAQIMFVSGLTLTS